MRSRGFILIAPFLLAACWNDAPIPHHIDSGPDVAHDGAEDAPERDALDDTGSLVDGSSEAGRDSGTGALCGVNGRDACGPYQRCSATLGCVDCATDDDCPRSAPRCDEGRCVACVAPVDAGTDAEAAGCPSGMTCWPGDHACHPACTDSASCPPSAKTCDARGACVACSGDGDCPTGLCAPSSRQCVECTSDAHCGGALPRCDLRAHMCVECSSNEDCGIAAPVCDPSTRRCRIGCTSDAQCPGERCDPIGAICVAPAQDAGAHDAAGE